MGSQPSSAEGSPIGVSHKDTLAQEKRTAFWQKYNEPQGIPGVLKAVGPNHRTFSEVEYEISIALPYAPTIVREEITARAYINSFFIEGRTAAVKEQYLLDLVKAHYGTTARPGEIRDAFKTDMVPKGMRYMAQKLFPGKEIDPASITRLRKPEDLPVPTGEVIRGDDDVWVYLERHYEPEAREIADLVESGQNVIVDGPFGVGKSIDLLGNVKNFLKADGVNVFRQPGAGRELSSFPSVLQTIQADKGVLILDEVGQQIRKKSIPELAKTVKTVMENGSTMIIINPGHSASEREELNQMMQEMAEQVGARFNVHKVKNMYVPDALARKHFEFLGADQDFIDFVLNPENKSLLSIRFFQGIKASRSMQQLISLVEGGLATDGSMHSLMLSKNGVSRSGVVKMLGNLGILTAHDREVIAQYPDY